MENRAGDTQKSLALETSLRELPETLAHPMSSASKQSLPATARHLLWRYYNNDLRKGTPASRRDIEQLLNEGNLGVEAKDYLNSFLRMKMPWE